MDYKLNYENMIVNLAEFFGRTTEEILKEINESDKLCWNYYKILNPRNEQEELIYYNFDKLLYSYVRWHFYVSIDARFRLAQKLNGKILDYGCGIATQDIFAIAVRRQVDIDLYEPSLLCRRYAEFLINKYKLTGIRPIKFLDEGFKVENKYDIIECFDVLEHLKDPKAKLIELIEWLKPEGKLLLRAPFEVKNDPSHKNNDFKLENLFKELDFKRYEIVEV